MFVITVGRIGRRGKQTSTLASREISIGRAVENELVLEDALVSRLHCRLVSVEGGALVLDEGSSNGTWLNGEPLAHPTFITFHDALVIGPYVLRVQSLVGRCTSGRAHLPTELLALAGLSFDRHPPPDSRYRGARQTPKCPDVWGTP